MHDTYMNPLCARYAGKEMQRLFSDDTKCSTWRRLWIALAAAALIILPAFIPISLTLIIL